MEHFEICVCGDEDEKEVLRLYNVLDEQEKEIRSLKTDLHDMTEDRDYYRHEWMEQAGVTMKLGDECEEYESKWLEEQATVEILQRELYDLKRDNEILSLKLRIKELEATKQVITTPTWPQPYGPSWDGYKITCTGDPLPKPDTTFWCNNTVSGVYNNTINGPMKAVLDTIKKETK